MSISPLQLCHSAVLDTVVDTVDQRHLSSHFPNANLQRWFGNEMRESEQQMAMLWGINFSDNRSTDSLLEKARLPLFFKCPFSKKEQMTILKEGPPRPRLLSLSHTRGWFGPKVNNIRGANIWASSHPVSFVKRQLGAPQPLPYPDLSSVSQPQMALHGGEGSVSQTVESHQRFPNDSSKYIWTHNQTLHSASLGRQLTSKLILPRLTSWVIWSFQ